MQEDLYGSHGYVKQNINAGVSWARIFWTQNQSLIRKLTNQQKDKLETQSKIFRLYKSRLNHINRKIAKGERWGYQKLHL